jgi:hypothetical protein
VVNTARLLSAALALTAFTASTAEAATTHKRVHHVVERQSGRAYNYVPENNADHEEHCYVPRPFTITCDH